MNREQAIESVTEGESVHFGDEIMADFAVSLVNTIYDEFESRICGNCYLQRIEQCLVFDTGYSSSDDFGCNEFVEDK